MSKNKLGLVLGSFLAFLHLVWSILVATIPRTMESFINWDLKIHHINGTFTVVTPFVLMNAITVIVLAFVVGYVFGCLLAGLFNQVHQS